ncbi:MAG: FMN reductase (NAD(P)H) [Firmicutes bacterium ADurb.BinA052]|nr:MAG: FMN reductase (NAD(P)H) [Firmicutes bacterium ADurb.BinA052]
MVNGAYPNKTIELLYERASCRSFGEEPIPDETLDVVLAAAAHAATGGNLQPYSIIKVLDSEVRQRLMALCGDQPFIGQAPVSLVFCIDFRRLERWAALEKAPFSARRAFRHFWISFQDVVICAQTVCTAANAMGLGAVYVGTVLECLEELRDLLKLPKGVFPVVMVCLGYPRGQLVPKQKLGVDVVVHDEVYREMTDEELLRAYDEKYGGQTFEATPERVDSIARACREVHGDDYAEEFLARVRRDGHLNTAQRVFGLNYPADEMPRRNRCIMSAARNAGLDWFDQGSEEQ